MTLVLAAASCGEKAAKSDTGEGSIQAAAPTRKDAGKPESDRVVPPKDAEWTLHCYVVRGPGHVENARLLKANMIKSTPMKQWYVIHAEDQSTLYYGFYKAIDARVDQKAANKAQEERRRIVGLTDVHGEHPFAGAVFVQLIAPDPDAPPEWDLRNAKGYWSLQIAAYQETADRKRVAVETVREARKMGVEAYYFHGESVSSVCIGVWPRESVREYEQDPATATPVNPSDEVVVTPFPMQGVQGEVTTPSGGRAKAVSPRNEVVDPTLIEKMNEYPEHSVNGMVMVRKVRDPRTGAEKQVPDRSFLVQIPQQSDSLLSSGNIPSPPSVERANPRVFTDPLDSAPGQSEPQPQQPTKPGVGKLKSIGG